LGRNVTGKSRSRIVAIGVALKIRRRCSSSLREIAIARVDTVFRRPARGLVDQVMRLAGVGCPIPVRSLARERAQLKNEKADAHYC
jgi:hypothetical protein